MNPEHPASKGLVPGTERFIRHPSSRWFRHRFQHVILHVTERCNLHCKTCFVRKTGRELTLEQARQIAHKLGRVRWLDIGGGEPFLHPDLVALCALFPDTAITIPTNGQDPERIEAAVETIAAAASRELTIALSLDGFEGVNDSIRGAGSHRKAMETFARLRKIPGIKLKINTVVCNANASELIPFMEQVRTFGPDYHSLLLLRGMPSDDAMALPPLEYLEEITPEVLRILGSYQYGDRGNPLLRVLKRRYQRYLWRVSLKTLAMQTCLVPCQAPALHKVVYPDGSLSMCELMPPVGNLLEESRDALESRMTQALELYESRHGRCFCTHNCNLAENIQTHPRSILSVLLGLDP